MTGFLVPLYAIISTIKYKTTDIHKDQTKCKDYAKLLTDC